ncbi:hypothetical protein GF325_04495 [Candidatus Bathyarchaeota archaeon]|nr:hypothetical protein [Candidatus Bathyarchaeota archaeon]
MNGEPPKNIFPRGLHRHDVPRVIEAAVDSMEAPPFMWDCSYTSKW